MKGNKVIPSTSNRGKPKKSPYRGYVKNTNLPKPTTLMMIFSYLLTAVILIAIFLKFRHFFLVHWK